MKVYLLIWFSAKLVLGLKSRKNSTQVSIFFSSLKYSQVAVAFLAPDQYLVWILSLMHGVLGKKSQAKGFFTYLYQEMLILAGSWRGLKYCPVCLSSNDISTLISDITNSKELKNTVQESQPNCSKALKINICISIMGNGLGKKRRICKSI